MVKGKQAWRASEAIAQHILEDMGYRIIDIHKRIIVDGVEVGEIDILAEKNGEIYAVEVKAGALDVSGVRQAYTNAKLLGYKPLVIARGVDEKARKLADNLGVELILMSDVVYAGVDEVRIIVREAVYDAIDTILEVLTKCRNIKEEDFSVLLAIATTSTINEAAQALGISIEALTQRISSLHKRGLLPRGNYRMLRLTARLLVACNLMISKEGVPRP